MSEVDRFQLLKWISRLCLLAGHADGEKMRELRSEIFAILNKKDR